MGEKKVYCPYCGNRMELDAHEDIGVFSYMCQKCASMSPMTDRRSEAIHLALKRYPRMQEPMTFDEIYDVKPPHKVWIQILSQSAFERDGKPKAVSSYYDSRMDYPGRKSFCCKNTVDMESYEFDYCDYGKTWIAFCHEPTDAEIDAVRRER